MSSVLTGASQASAYEAIARLARAGVLRRLTAVEARHGVDRGDMIDEADRVLRATRRQDGEPSRRLG